MEAVERRGSLTLAWTVITDPCMHMVPIKIKIYHIIITAVRHFLHQMCDYYRRLLTITVEGSDLNQSLF